MKLSNKKLYETYSEKIYEHIFIGSADNYDFYLVLYSSKYIVDGDTSSIVNYWFYLNSIPVKYENLFKNINKLLMLL